MKIDTFIICVVCLSFKFSGLLAKSTFIILPSAGETIILLKSGVTLSGSLKKYTHQRESINPIQPKKSDSKDSKREMKKNNAING